MYTMKIYQFKNLCHKTFLPIWKYLLTWCDQNVSGLKASVRNRLEQPEGESHRLTLAYTAHVRKSHLPILPVLFTVVLYIYVSEAVRRVCHVGKTGLTKLHRIFFNLAKHANIHNLLHVVHDWYKSFKGGRESIENDERSGRPATSKIEENIELVCASVVQNRRIIILELSTLVSVQFNEFLYTIWA